VTTWTLFASGTPDQGNLSDGPYTLTTGWEINTPGSYWCVGIEWFAPASLPSGDIVVGLFRRTDDATNGGLLASKIIPVGSITPGQRNTFLFDPGDEVPVAQGDVGGFYAALYTPDRYVATGSFFASSAHTNGPITAWLDSGGARNGRFFIGGASLTYPNGQFNSAAYWVSPVVTDEDPGEEPVTVVDTPGPALAGGSPEAVTADTVVVDAPSPVAPGGVPEAATAGAVVADVPGGATAGGTPDVALTNEPVTVVDTPGGASPGGSPATVTVSETDPDAAVWPLLLQALACLETEMAGIESPPRYVSLRPGVAFSAGLSQMEDECCEGSAWIRVVSISPTNNFPAPATEAGNCSPAALSVELELGALRCVPTSSNLRKDRVVTGTQWQNTVRLIMGDAAALRRTACCIAGLVGNHVIGTWTPTAVEANCVGGTMSMTIQAPACDFTC